MKKKLILLIVCVFFLIFGCRFSEDYLLDNAKSFMLAVRGPFLDTEVISSVTENISVNLSITTSVAENEEGTVRVYSKDHRISDVDTQIEYFESFFTYSDYYYSQTEIYLTGTLESTAAIAADQNQGVNSGTFEVTGLGFTEAHIYWTSVYDTVTDELIELSGMLITDKRDFDIMEIYPDL